MNTAFSEARTKAGFSKRKLWKVTGINRGTIHNIEVADQKPQLETAIVLADTIGITDLETFKKVFLPGYVHNVNK